MDTTETSEEDKGRFGRLLVEYVEATDKMTVETLELWHTRIRQCILQHKKDQSRLPLFEVGNFNHINPSYTRPIYTVRLLPKTVACTLLTT